MKHGDRFLRLVESARKSIRECSVVDVKARFDRKDLFHFLDVREESEFSRGHAAGARHLGRGILERDIEQMIPDKEAEIILYCGGGFRSALAAQSLGKMGYRRVLSMAGGIRAWREAGLPLEK
ncbi:MAG: rhodanese-like domain-containing protein [Acidobacteria bacterium]|nr:rhodanese-like domain-containing protein [Acidobacteriota bacterium]